MLTDLRVEELSKRGYTCVVSRAGGLRYALLYLGKEAPCVSIFNEIFHYIYLKYK